VRTGGVSFEARSTTSHLMVRHPAEFPAPFVVRVLIPD